MPNKYQVFIQTYKGNQITDSLKATFVSLDDTLAYRDWICSGNSLFVAYIREEKDPEESVLERAMRAYGNAERESESEDERKRRQRRETMSKEHAKQLNHHKYRRCLDKAELCHWKAGVFIYKKEKNDFYYRWYERWLKVAEKYKEVK